MRSLFWGVAFLAAASSVSTAADRRAERYYSPVAPVVEQFTYSWVAMPPLPRRNQNHCGWWQGHYICADHCGTDYQVYSCSKLSTGCCHIGRGYCDYSGILRCSPGLF
jgi:hypothetical protein